MEQLAVKYADRGFQILCFPSNQFGGQEPWDHPKIQRFVDDGWPNLNAQLFEKIDVNGEGTHPVYAYLKGVYPGDIGWNFASKFVIARDGVPCARFDSSQSWEDIEARIVQELEKEQNQ